MPVDTREPSTSAAPTARSGSSRAGHAGSFVVIHPRYEASLLAKGLHRAEDFLNLPGEVVSGHPDRHVVQVKLDGSAGHSQVAYLKRQHFVRRLERVKNAFAGFGYVSKSVREAMVLRRLEEIRIDAPPWIAYGESQTGQAFLLVADVSPRVELRALLSDSKLSKQDRDRCSLRIGQYLAELHAAGIHHPDSTAKHCYVHPTGLSVLFIDWQGATLRNQVSAAQAARSFAVIHASLNENLCSVAERLRALWSYRRTLRSIRLTQGLPRLANVIAVIESVARNQWNRRSIREQRQSHSASANQRLVWLAGEAACVVPELVSAWPTPADGPPFYRENLANHSVAIESIDLAKDRVAVLLRRRSCKPFARFWASIRSKSWRSPELQLARILFHLERNEVPAPRLLGFGQKLQPRGVVESFLLYETPHNTLPLSEWLQSSRSSERRARILETSGVLIRQIHRAGCRIDAIANGEPVIHVTRGQPLVPVVFSAVRSLRLVKAVTPRERSRDLRRLLRGPLAYLDDDSRRQFLQGYHGGNSDAS